MDGGRNGEFLVVWLSMGRIWKEWGSVLGCGRGERRCGERCRSVEKCGGGVRKGVEIGMEENMG